MPTPNIPAIGTISDPTKVRVALMQGNQAVNGPPLSVVADAVGVPSGGTTGQVLTKSSDTDYDNEWADAAQGDLSGPASAVDGNFAAFDGTTGKLVKDSGKKASDFQTALGYTPANVAGDTFTGPVTFAGIDFGSVVASSATDTSKHIDLWGGVYGFSITGGTLNHVSGGSRHDFYAGTSFIGRISSSGLTIGSPTGGDPGAGKVNATEYQINGTALPLAKSYESAQQAITSGGTLSLTHGLGGQPKLYQAFLVNVTTEGGYSAGDEVAVNPAYNAIGSEGRGVSMVPSSTAISVRFGSNAGSSFTIIRKDTGALVSITNTNWKFIVRAWL